MSDNLPIFFLKEPEAYSTSPAGYDPDITERLVLRADKVTYVQLKTHVLEIGIEGGDKILIDKDSDLLGNATLVEMWHDVVNSLNYQTLEIEKWRTKAAAAATAEAAKDLL